MNRLRGAHYEGQRVESKQSEWQGVIFGGKRREKTRKAPEILHFFRIMRSKHNNGGKARRVGGKEIPGDAKGATMVAKRDALVAKNTSHCGGLCARSRSFLFFFFRRVSYGPYDLT